MNGVEAGIAGFVALLVLMVIRIPIGVAMITVGLGGYAALRGWDPTLAYVKLNTFSEFSRHSLSVIPLFLLMGELATKAGLSRALFNAAHAFFGHRRGGMAMAAIGACAGFGSICGSSLATAATMARVALPEMRRHGYSGALATGSLAAGGTLGILIPPSVVLVIYAILTEQNIAKMFAAALVPGTLAIFGYAAAVAVYVRLRPGEGPTAERMPVAARLRALAAVWPVAGIFLLVVGGIYLGWFVPTQGAAIGAFATGILAVWRGGMRLDGFIDCLLGTAKTTGMIFLILLGAAYFNAFLSVTGLPAALAQIVGGGGLPPMAVLIAILILYLVMGCFMDSLSMILLTVPIFYPIIAGLDFGLTPEETLIWFGIIALIVVEIGLITPPVGLNVFVINALARDVPMAQTFRGVLPFLVTDIVRVIVLMAFPVITLALVRLLFP